MIDSMTTTTLRRRPKGHAERGSALNVAGVAGAPDETAAVPLAMVDVQQLASLRDLPGLAARLASMAAELRLIARNTPVWTMPEVGLGDAIEQAQAVREMAHSLSAVLAAEVTSRGLPEASGLSRNDWVAGHAPGLAAGASAALTAVGAAMNDPRWARLAGGVRDGEVSVDQAAVIVRFRDDVVTFAEPDQVEQVVDAMVEAAPQLGVRELRRLASHGRASLRPPVQVEDEAQRLRAARSLTKVGRCAGMTEYLWRLDPEGSAVLDAAVDALARPRPDLDWSSWPSGQPGGSSDAGKGAATDPRSPATRRADAALELIQRAVAAPQGVTRTSRTKLVVTMSLEALLDRLRGAGVADNDEVLPASTVRRVACEAEILPTVLGGPSQVLDIGRADRYFTPAQRLAMGLRDHGCSYPRCTVPPQWCDAHHVVHWLHGGATDLSNGALLCGRHHTIVHQLGLTATVLPDEVVWHVPRGHRRE
jgi:hypothetical protein